MKAKKKLLLFDGPRHKDCNVTKDTRQTGKGDAPQEPDESDQTEVVHKKKPVEIGGRKGPEPTRYGDWEKNGIISDF